MGSSRQGSRARRRHDRRRRETERHDLRRHAPRLSDFPRRAPRGRAQARDHAEHQYGAPGATLRVYGAKFREIARDSSFYPLLAYTPVLFARANTVGKFTDVPMIVYVERLVENGEPLLSYTVIFSNEDGGTSTRALMARWGRTTDVEYVYKAFLNPDGTLKRATMQGRGHHEVEFNGQRDGTHPLMIPVTDNNMVSGEATSAIRYQIAPSEIDLSHHSRELIIDQQPLAYRVMSSYAREGKMRPYGT